MLSNGSILQTSIIFTNNRNIDKKIKLQIIITFWEILTGLVRKIILLF